MSPWTVFRVAALFYLTMLLMTLLAGVLLWLFLTSLGAVESVETFVADLGFENFTLRSGRLLAGGALVGLALTLFATVMTTVMAALYNVISDVVGGIEVQLSYDERS